MYGFQKINLLFVKGEIEIRFNRRVVGGGDKEVGYLFRNMICWFERNQRCEDYWGEMGMYNLCGYFEEGFCQRKIVSEDFQITL